MDLIGIFHTICETTIVYLGLLAISRFVFLEKGITGQSERHFHITAIVISILAKLIYPDDFWITLVPDIFIGINIFIGRDEKKIISTLLTLPIMGLVDGLIIPVSVIPNIFFGDHTPASINYQTAIYALTLAAIGTAFVFRKKELSVVFSDASERTLKGWERALLCFIGLSLAAYNYVMIFLNASDLDMNVRAYNIVLFFFSILCFLMTISVIAVVLVGNRQHHYFNKISDMQFSIITMMAEIVENRDKNTGGHIKRTAKYVEIIAKQLKRSGKFPEILTEEYIKNIIVAAPLHDIGKIHVSDTILNKEGPLEDDEYAIMKTHAIEGQKLLSQAKEHLGNFEYLNIAMQMAGYHHEWYDGSRGGYPDRMKGEEIPLCARIMAVADVFDALTTKRCYKNAMPLSKAYSIIKSERGSHFDPTVVDAFFEASAHIEAALREFNKELDIDEQIYLSK